MIYSKYIKGCTANYNQSVSFSKESGFVSIYQEGEGVLLSPKQLKALFDFVKKGKHEND